MGSHFAEKFLDTFNIIYVSRGVRSPDMAGIIKVRSDKRDVELAECIRIGKVMESSVEKSKYLTGF